MQDQSANSGSGSLDFDPADAWSMGLRGSEVRAASIADENDLASVLVDLQHEALTRQRLKRACQVATAALLPVCVLVISVSQPTWKRVVFEVVTCVWLPSALVGVGAVAISARSKVVRVLYALGLLVVVVGMAIDVDQMAVPASLMLSAGIGYLMWQWFAQRDATRLVARLQEDIMRSQILLLRGHFLDVGEPASESRGLKLDRESGPIGIAVAPRSGVIISVENADGGVRRVAQQRARAQVFFTSTVGPILDNDPRLPARAGDDFTGVVRAMSDRDAQEITHHRSRLLRRTLLALLMYAVGAARCARFWQSHHGQAGFPVVAWLAAALVATVLAAFLLRPRNRLGHALGLRRVLVLRHRLRDYERLELLPPHDLVWSFNGVPADWRMRKY